MDNYTRWSERYREERSGNNNPYSDNDYNIFPRYNVLAAIQQGVERLVGQDFENFESCRQQLIEKGHSSHSILTIDGNEELHYLGESGVGVSTSGQQNPIEKAAIAEERSKFIEFVNSRTFANVADVEPLPYRHRLTDPEMISVRGDLLEIWNYDGGYWDPLDEKSPRETVFLMQQNLTNNDHASILGYIKSNADKKLFLVSEERIDYEIESDGLDLELYETIVTDRSNEWVIYGSHENTITFGGANLIDFVKDLFADRVELLNKWE